MKYVGTYSDPKDIVTKEKLEAVASRVSTNEDNIAMAESDIDGLQTSVGTLQTSVNNVQTALTSKQDTVVGGASTITEDNLTASRALVSNSSGKVDVSTVTSTELGYLDGVTSNVQTQLNKKLEKAPVTSVNSKTGAVHLNASDVGALPNTTVIPTKTSQLDNDSGFITDIPIASATQLGGVKVGAGLSVTENGVLSATGGGTADSVEWNNVLDKPTTIAGYGITDAKIENGTITLGNQTITPLTSAPVTSVNSKTGNVVLTQDDVGDGTTYVRTHNDFTDALKTQINTNKDNIAMAEGDIDGLQTSVGTLQTSVNNVQTSLASKQDTVVGGASTITEDNLTASRALVSNSSGKVAVSNVTSTELGYLDGVTSNVQTQLDKKLENIPIATSTTLGGVKPVAKTSDMTQSVGVDANGALYTAPGGGGTGSGDMLKSVYDPQNKSTDIFKYANDAANARQAKILVDGILEGDGAGNISAAETVQTELLDVEVLPTVTTADNGKILKVTNGAWVAQQPTTEAWTFTLEDGSTITKKVCIE